jgi:NADH dehydrogenase FAD-containing subunit
MRTASLSPGVSASPRIEVRLKTTVEAIGEETVVLQSEGRHETFLAANVVLAAEMRSNNDLAEELKAASFAGSLFTAGSCNVPRLIKEAIEEGAMAARHL